MLDNTTSLSNFLSVLCTGDEQKPCVLIHVPCGDLLDIIGDLDPCVLHVFCIKWAVNKGPIKKMNHKTCREHILLQYSQISLLTTHMVLPYEEKQIRSRIFMVLF